MGDTPPRADSWLFPAGWYLGILAVMVFVSWQTITHTTVLIDSVEFRGDQFLGGLIHYDGGWYWLVSERGYRDHQPGIQSPVAFFPGYPLAMRYLGAVIGDHALAGILITTTCGLGTAVLFWSWCRERMTAIAANTALLTYLLYPYGYYLYGVIYADALFVFFTLLAFWAVERDRPLLAGLAGAVATLSRPVGIAVVVGLAVRTLERRGVLPEVCLPKLRPRNAAAGDTTSSIATSGIAAAGDTTPPGTQRRSPGGARSTLRPTDGFVLLSVSGLAAYCYFLWNRFGDPFLFSDAEAYWGQGTGPSTWFKVALYEQLRDHWDSAFTWGLVVQGFVALAALATVPLVARRFGWGYAAYLLVVLAVPVVGTKDFQGLGRYGIAAFPVFALLGEVLADRPARERGFALACSGLALVIAGFGFAHGYYIS